MSTTEVAARQLNRIAWALALPAIALLVVRLAQGVWPDQCVVDAFWPRCADEQTFLRNGIVLAVAYFVLAVALIPKLLLVSVGRPWSWRTSVERPLPLSIIEAREIAERALASLIEIGWTVDPFELLADGGWRMRARQRRGRRWVDDPRNARQHVEFEWSPSGAVMRHAFARKVDRYERGEREYQRWLVDALLAGRTLRNPPRQLPNAPIVLLASGAFIAVTTAIVHLLPEAARDTWVVLSLMLLAAAPGWLIGFLSYRSDRHLTTGWRVTWPALLLHLCGAFLWFARQDEWQSATWRTSDDPRTLCVAGASAEREVSACLRPRILSARDERATEALRAIERRLVAMGPEAVPALLALWKRDVALRMPDDVLRRMGSRGVPALLLALGSPDAAIRTRAIWALKHARGNSRVVDAVGERLCDVDHWVRSSAIEFFDRDGVPWSDAVGAAIIQALINGEERAVRAVGQRRWRPAVPALIERLGRETVDYKLRALCDALGQIGDPSAVPALAARARVRDGSAPLALAKLGSPGIEALLDLLDGPNGDNVRHALDGAAYGVKLPSSTVDRLIRMADADATALSLLSETADERALARAASELRGEHGWRVLHALRRRGRATADDVAFWMAKKQSCWWASGEDADILARIASDEGKPASLRVEALHALGEMEPLRAAALSERLLRELPAQDRAGAVSRHLSTDALVPLLRDPSAGVRRAAVDALGHRNEPRVAEAIALLTVDPDERVLESAVRWLGSMRARAAVDELVAVVERRGCSFEKKRARPWIVHAAVRALGEIGDARAQAVLRKVMRRAWWTGAVRGYYLAASALVMCGDRDMVPALLAALMSPLSSSG